MKRFYDNFEFKPNLRTDKIIKRELVDFYDTSDYHFGKYWRVQLPYTFKGEKYDNRKYLMTFVFLNPNLDVNIYWKFFHYCNKNMSGFVFDREEYKSIVANRGSITYTDCYRVLRKMVYNERKFAKKFGLSVYNKSFKIQIKDSLRDFRKKWWNDSNQEMLKDVFFESMNNINLSYESLALDSRLSIETVERHLNKSKIYIREDELEYQIVENSYDSSGRVTGVKSPKPVIVKRQPYREYIIESHLKFLLSRPNDLFTIEEIVDGCKYYSQYYQELIQLSRSTVEQWIKAHKYYMVRIKDHILTFKSKKEKIIRQNKIMFIYNLIEIKNAPIGKDIEKEYTRNKNGRSVRINNFGEEMGGDHGIGSYKNSYTEIHDVDDELDVEEFEL